VQFPHPAQVVGQRLPHTFGQQGPAVVPAFAVPHHQLIQVELHVLHPQP
jgi:hypothetical protein